MRRADPSPRGTALIAEPRRRLTQRFLDATRMCTPDLDGAVEHQRTDRRHAAEGERATATVTGDEAGALRFVRMRRELRRGDAVAPAERQCGAVLL